MSLVEITEEIVSEVDLNVEFTTKGLSVSTFVDECEIHDAVDYDVMAYHMVGDREKYPDEALIAIYKGLKTMVDIIEEAIDDGRE